MAYRFLQASAKDTENIFPIYEKRVRWMAEKGLRQWDCTDYLNTYPLSYYEEHRKMGRLYVMKNEDGTIAAAMVLLSEDPRWQGADRGSAYYVHNFATDMTVKGIGSLMLEEAEKLARAMGKEYMRLDCPSHNTYLNGFYEDRGYVPAGRCVDGPYTGNRKEKKLVMKNADLFETIFTRASYRGKFTDSPVPREDLELIMKAGLAAPSGCNCQTPVFVAIDSEEKLAEVRKIFPRSSMLTAPACILVFTQQIPGIDGRFYNVEDYAASIENMLLAIKGLGYDSCWYQGSVREGAEEFCRLAAMPDNYSFICLLPVGKALEEAKCRVSKLGFDQRAWFNSYGQS